MGILKDFPTYCGVIPNTQPCPIKSVDMQKGKDTTDFPRSIIDLMVNVNRMVLESLDEIGD
jgi:hypothetical protein